MENTDLQDLLDLFGTLRVYIGRADVRGQLVALALVALGAGLLTALLRRRFFRPLTRYVENAAWDGWLGRTAHFALTLAQAVAFPLLGMALVQALLGLRVSQGLLTGLIEQLQGIFATILAIEMAMALLLAILSPDQARRAQWRLRAPLLLVIVSMQVLDQFIDLGILAAVDLVDFFGNPITLGGILAATVGLYLYIAAITVLKTALLNTVTRWTHADPGATDATLTLLRYALILVGVAYILSQLNLDTTTLAAVMGGLSVGIGFGLREVLSNFVSGILLLLERSLHPGDVVELDGELCVVRHLSMRATVVRTLFNEEIVVPNQRFLTSSFKTYTGTDRTVCLALTIRTDCTIQPPAVMALLCDAARAHPLVLTTPEPEACILEYANNEAVFHLYLWINDPMIGYRVRSEVKTMVWDALKAHNVALPMAETRLFFDTPLDALGPDKERDGAQS